MSFSVSGKTAIVTGAAAGIGLAIARHLVDKGANVMFADSDEERLEDEVGDVPAVAGFRSVHLLADDVRARPEGHAARPGLVDLLEEDPLEGAAEVMATVGVQQPLEDVGELLLVSPVVHDVEDVEARLP